MSITLKTFTLSTISAVMALGCAAANTDDQVVVGRDDGKADEFRGGWLEDAIVRGRWTDTYVANGSCESVADVLKVTEDRLTWDGPVGVVRAQPGQVVEIDATPAGFFAGWTTEMAMRFYVREPGAQRWKPITLDLLVRGEPAELVAFTHLTLDGSRGTATFAHPDLTRGKTIAFPDIYDRELEYGVTVFPLSTWGSLTKQFAYQLTTTCDGSNCAVPTGVRRCGT